MIPAENEEKMLASFNDLRGEVIKLFQKIFSYPFTKETTMIMFYAEPVGCGFVFSARPQKSFYEDAPLYYDENGIPVYKDIARMICDFSKAMDVNELRKRGELENYLIAAEPLFAQWLHKRWKEVGGENLPLQFLLTFQNDYPSYYDLRTLKYERELGKI